MYPIGGGSVVGSLVKSCQSANLVLLITSKFARNLPLLALVASFYARYTRPTILFIDGRRLQFVPLVPVGPNDLSDWVKQKILNSNRGHLEWF